MQIELIPDPGPDDALVEAATAALARQGVTDVEPRRSAMSAWRNAGLQEMGERNASSDGRVSDAAVGMHPGEGYVPPAPSRRGATRA